MDVKCDRCNGTNTNLKFSQTDILVTGRVNRRIHWNILVKNKLKHVYFCAMHWNKMYDETRRQRAVTL
jgi:hypothetical protein